MEIIKDHTFKVYALTSIRGDLTGLHVLVDEQGWQPPLKEMREVLLLELYELPHKSQEEVIKAVNKLEKTLLVTSSFWTCKCRKHFLHHNGIKECFICGGTKTNSPNKTVYLATYLQELAKSIPHIVDYQLADKENITFN